MMKWFIEAVVDLIYPPEEGEEVPFYRKLIVFIVLILLLLALFAL